MGVASIADRGRRGKVSAIGRIGAIDRIAGTGRTGVVIAGIAVATGVIARRVRR